MKTLIISGAGPALPAALRDVIARGSTAVEERTAKETAAANRLDAVDRIVIWSPGDAATARLAEQYAAAERKARREAIVFVTTDEGSRVAGLAEHEQFCWPRDEDRLVMAFMTGA